MVMFPKLKPCLPIETDASKKIVLIKAFDNKDKDADTLQTNLVDTKYEV